VDTHEAAETPVNRRYPARRTQINRTLLVTDICDAS
jgi:hypothetical protein